MPGRRTPPSSDPPPQWEARTAQRVVDASRDQILERSRRIVEAAYELLAESGLDGLTIRAVLRRTGLSRRAFYDRFEGKDDLVLAVFEQGIRRAAQLFAELTAPMADPLERLQLIVTYIVLGKGMQSPDSDALAERRAAALSREHLRLAEARPGDLQAALRPLIALLAQQLEAGMNAGVVRRDDPQRLATLLYNLVSTTVHSELLSRENTPTDRQAKLRLADDVWEFCRRAIAA